MSRKFVNYYEILSVSKNASENQIRKAYGEKLREYRQLRKNRTDVDFNVLAKAYRVLSDENDREFYDRKLEDYLYQKKLRAEEKEREENNMTVIEKYHALKGKEKRRFYKRHEALENDLIEEYGDSKDFTIRLKKGTIHVLGETIYNINSMCKQKNDTVKKYVIRNRKKLGVIVLAGFLAVGINVAKNINNKNNTPTTITTTDENTETYTFNKIYHPKKGDTLWELSQEFGVSQSEIKNANQDLFSNTELIYDMYEYKIPYKVTTNNIDEYTDIVDNGSLTVKELAKEYDTDVSTLLGINENNVEYDYDKQEYVFTKDQAIVPSFDEIIEKSK